MIQNHQLTLNVLPEESRLYEAFEVLDDLHTAASENTLPVVTSLDKRELLGWLRDLVFTAQETIAEIEKQSVSTQPYLRILEKPVAFETTD